MNSLLLQPVPTGDATARYERLSHGGATWYDLMPTPANAADGGAFIPVPPAPAVANWPNFDGASWCSIGNPAKLDFAGAFTLCVWAYQDPAVPHQGTEFFIGKDGVGGRDAGLTSADNANDVKGFIFTPGYAAAQTAGSPPGVFYYIAFVNEGAAGDLKLYVDGDLKATNVGSGATELWSAAPWEFGRDTTGAPQAELTGTLDTGRFYNRALSPDEILRDYHAGKPAHP